MTQKQRKEHKIGNQIRKARLLRLYYKVSPKERGWLPLGGICQSEKYAIETGIPIYDAVSV